jgi:hypothetical protein
MDPEDELKDYKSDKDLESMPTGLTVQDQALLFKARMRLRGSTYRYLLSLVEYAFNSGWLACKYLTGKKRTEKVQEDELRSFMDKIKGL